MSHPLIVRHALGCIVACVVIAALVAAPAAAQNNGSFTVDDYLDVVNVRVAALSDDGRWLAATASTQRDRIGIDNYRYGDPTYTAPSTAEVWIIDTQTGERQSLFPGRMQVRALAWSRDGGRLAMLVLEGEIFRPRIWDRPTRRFSEVDLPEGWIAASNAQLLWTANDRELLIATRPAEWMEEARRQFEHLTRGPIVTLSSDEPFLAWEQLRRLSTKRSLIAYDVERDRSRTILPDMMLSSYRVSEDGQVVTYLEDETEETDYEVIFGTDTKLAVIPAAGGEPRTLVPSINARGIRWSGDGRRYAYAEKGSMYVGSVDDEEPTQLTGKDESDDGEEAGEVEDDPDAEDGEDEGRFSPVRMNRDGTRLVASNKQGLWWFDATSGDRGLFLEKPEDDDEAPNYEVLDWSPDGSGIYLTYNSRTEWEL